MSIMEFETVRSRMDRHRKIAAPIAQRIAKKFFAGRDRASLSEIDLTMLLMTAGISSISEFEDTKETT